MAYTVPSFADIRDALLRDISNLLPEADTGEDSDFFVRASSVASAVEGLYQHQAWTVRQIFPDTADSDYLVLHARVRGLTPKSAVAADGSLRLAGTPGTVVGSGLVSAAYTTTDGGTVGADGTLLVAAVANTAGEEGNADAGTVVTLTAAPSGVSSQATIVSMSGGTEAETDAELLARLLDLIRRPPAGGNKYDYRRWALEVNGVSAAYVYPLRRGLGTVDVVITSAGALPAAATITATQNYIDDQRPVTAKNCLVLSPTLRTVDVHIAVSLSGTTLAAVTALIAAAVAEYFDQLAPGETAYKSRIEALVSGIDGVVDRAVSAPGANVVPTVDASVVEWVRLGNLVVTALP